MPVKLDLRKQTKLDEEIRQDAPTEASTKKVSRKQTNVRAKKGQGRPKGEPAVTRSLRIKESINDKLVEEQARTGLSFNELANRAFAEYLK